jgi:hypothetical protein
MHNIENIGAFYFYAFCFDCFICLLEGAAGWNGQRLLRGDLHLDSAFWNLFISASLKPSSHTGEIFKEASQILYAIRTGRYIDVAGFIKKEIRGCGRQTSTSIIFPCLITAMCAAAGLVVDDDSRDDTSEPDTPLCQFTWNTQATMRGLPQIGETTVRKRRRGDDILEEQDPQDEDQQGPHPAQQAYGDAGYQTVAGSSQQRPEWVEYMLSTMQDYVRSEVASLRSDMYSRFDTMQISIDEIHRAVVRPAQPSDPSPPMFQVPLLQFQRLQPRLEIILLILMEVIFSGLARASSVRTTPRDTVDGPESTD